MPQPCCLAISEIAKVLSVKRYEILEASCPDAIMVDLCLAIALCIIPIQLS